MRPATRYNGPRRSSYRTALVDAINRSVWIEELLVEHPGHRIFYKDAMGNWDELVHDGARFTGFAPGARFRAGP